MHGVTEDLEINRLIFIVVERVVDRLLGQVDDCSAQPAEKRSRHPLFPDSCTPCEYDTRLVDCKRGRYANWEVLPSSTRRERERSEEMSH